MYETSPEWKENQSLPLTSEGFVEVSYEISDPNLKVDNMSDNDGSLKLLSQTPAIIIDMDRDNIVPYATLEQDLWLLDGSKVTVPETVPEEGYGYSGYISDKLCYENGSFIKDKLVDKNPLISIMFNNTVTTTLPGLTITWGAAHGEYPKIFKITPYNGFTAYDPKIVDNNKDVISIVNFDMTNFNKVEIEIIEWCRGGRRARIGKIFLGINKVYTKSNLLRLSCSERIDPVSSSLPKYEIQFEIDNRDGAFNPTNQEGLTKYMMERQEIRTRYGYLLGEEVEWIPGGVYYLSDWSAPQSGRSATFTARDLLGFLNAPYYKGIFPDLNLNPKGISLYALAEDVLNEANLPKGKDGKNLWFLEYDPSEYDSLDNIYTKSPLPICSMAECLQLIANAARCTIFFDRDGILRIEPLKDSNVELEINDDNSYSKAEINLTKPVKQIEVSKYEYTNKSNLEEEFYNKTLILNKGTNELLLEYPEVAKNVTVTVRGENVTIKENNCYAKCCELILDSKDNETSCTVTISGIVQTKTESIIVIPNPNHAKGEVQPLKNILITDEINARTVGGWLKNNFHDRKHFTVDWRIDPSLDTGDLVKIKNGKNENIMRVTSSSFSFSGAFKGKNEGSALSNTDD